MRKIVRRLMLGALLGPLAVALPASADPIYTAGFVFVNNTSGLADDLLPQLKVEVSMFDSDTAYFTFSNGYGLSGNVTSTISEIYWDVTNPAVLNSATFGVVSGTPWTTLDTTSASYLNNPWTTEASPGSLPGTISPDLVTYVAADRGGSRGITAGNKVTFRMDLASGMGQTNLYDALTKPIQILAPGADPTITTVDLRFGLHIKIPDGSPQGSDSFYSPANVVTYLPPPPPPLDNVVPVPGAAGLGLLGMALVAKFRKKRR